MSGITLPTKKVKAESTSPNNLIIYSKPKVGKTELCAQLEDALLLDLEEGSKFVDAMKIGARTVEEIIAIGQEVKKAGNPYKYTVVDTTTALETMCVPYAEKLYAAKAVGKKWFLRNADGSLHVDSGKLQYGDILNLPNGSGYAYLREAMTKVTEYIKTWAPRTIFLAHVKDVHLEMKGVEVSAADLDLTGKIKRILSSQSDGIGYLYRKGNQNILTFATKDTVACGARPKHLRNADIVISEMKDGELITHWNEVYMD